MPQSLRPLWSAQCMYINKNCGLNVIDVKTYQIFPSATLCNQGSRLQHSPRSPLCTKCLNPFSLLKGTVNTPEQCEMCCSYSATFTERGASLARQVTFFCCKVEIHFKMSMWMQKKKRTGNWKNGGENGDTVLVCETLKWSRDNNSAFESRSIL
jgi:hypothetical protein